MSEAGFEDFLAYFHRIILLWVGLAAIGLYTANLSFVALLTVVSQALLLLSTVLPSGFVSQRYMHSALLTLAPWLFQIAFGTVALLRDGVQLRFGQASGTSPYLDVAVTLVLFIQSVFAFALCFNYDGVLSGFVQPHAGLRVAGVQAFGEFVGLSLATASVAMGVFYMAADSSDTRLIIAGMSAVMSVYTMVLQDEMQLMHIEPLPAMVFNFVQLLAVLGGICLTLKTEMWEPVTHAHAHTTTTHIPAPQ